MSFCKLLTAIATSFILSTAANAQDCTCDTVDGAVESIFEASSVNGREMKLRFEANPVTRATKQAYLCIEPANTVALAKLWMSGHGHGSTPTKLVELRPGCTRIEKIEFAMTGVWDIQIKTADNDSGIFKFDVQRAN